MIAKNLLREVIEAVEAFDARELWNRFENFHCFAIHLDGREHPLVGSVMGAGAEQFGLMLLRGPHAAACFAAIAEQDVPSEDLIEQMDTLGFSIEPFEEMDESLQRYYHDAGIRPAGADAVPFLVSKPSDRLMRAPDERELKTLLMVLNGVVAADRQGRLEPTEPDDPAGVCTLTLTGDASAPTVAVRRERLEVVPLPSPSPFIASGIDLEGLPRLRETWLVGTPPLSAGVENDDRSLQLVLVVDEATRTLRQGYPVFAGDVREAVEAVAGAFRPVLPDVAPGAPARMVFSNRRLYDAMAPALEAQAVRCEFRPVLPALTELTEGLLQFAGASTMGALLDELLEEAFADALPDADDLEAWQAADRSVRDGIAAYLDGGPRARSKRAANRYFGTADAEAFLRRYREQHVAEAYAAWLVLDYRPTRTSETEAEKLLDTFLPDDQEALFRARMDSHVSLYRIVACDPDAGTLALEDLLLGGSTTVHHPATAAEGRPGRILPARLFPAGDFYFLDHAGPLLTAAQADAAVEALRAEGLTFTPDALQRGAHLFGRLWRWYGDTTDGGD